MIELCLALVPSAGLLGDGATVVRVADTAALRRALASASPGTRIELAAGTYEGFGASEIHGASGREIVVTAAEGAANACVFRGGVQLSDVTHFEWRGLVVQGAPGNGLNVDDGGTFDSPSHHVTLRDVRVIDCGGRGNDDGIKLSGVEDFVITGCTVERWGRGGSAVDMVGCRRGLIVDSAFRDREEGTAATGVQAKGGSRDVIVRHCRFEHAGERAVNIGGSTGSAYFRPKPEGFEARAVTVEGCTFVGSTAPIAFVGADGATVRFNTFHRPRKWFLRILQETREAEFVPCRRGTFTDNLVVYRASEVATPVNIGPGTAPETFSFARNYWYCEDQPTRSPPPLPVAEDKPAGGKPPRFVDAERGDLGVLPDSPARAVGAHALPPVKKPGVVSTRPATARRTDPYSKSTPSPELLEEARAL